MAQLKNRNHSLAILGRGIGCLELVTKVLEGLKNNREIEGGRAGGQLERQKGKGMLAKIRAC